MLWSSASIAYSGEPDGRRHQSEVVRTWKWANGRNREPGRSERQRRRTVNIESLLFVIPAVAKLVNQKDLIGRRRASVRGVSRQSVRIKCPWPQIPYFLAVLTLTEHVPDDLFVVSPSIHGRRVPNGASLRCPSFCQLRIRFLGGRVSNTATLAPGKRTISIALRRVALLSSSFGVPYAKLIPATTMEISASPTVRWGKRVAADPSRRSLAAAARYRQRVELSLAC